MESSSSAPVGFPSTLWTLVREAGNAEQDEARRREALGALIQRYWKPVFWYLRLSHERDAATAMDLTQSFFLHVLESGFAGKASLVRGRFRSFLKVSLRNYITDRGRIEGAAKRGGRGWSIPFEEAERESARLLGAGRELTPEDAFEREWRAAVVKAAVDSVRRRFEEINKPLYYEAFRLEDLDGGGKVPYREIAGRLEISEDDVRNYLRVAREAFRECVRIEIRETVGSSAEAGEELQELFSWLQ